MIITTTNSIENAEIEKYFGVVSTNVVLGTNVFSEFAASFTDFFGGTSETYQRKLDIIYKSAIDTLSQKATMLGANCIVGLHVDFDEISGKGKSMFMISAIGTAAKVNVKQQVTANHLSVNSVVYADQLSAEYQKRDLIARLEDGELLSPEDWSFLSTHPVNEAAPLLLDKYLLLPSTPNSEDEIQLAQNMSPYLNRLDKEMAIQLVSERIDKNTDEVIKLICSCNLFDAGLVTSLFKKGEVNTAIKLLDANKESYASQDLLSMKEIVVLIDHLPEEGKIEIVKGVFSKGEEKYICPHGHKNPATNEFCQEYGCGINIKGLTRFQLKKIDAFKLKVQSLDALLKQ